MSIEEQKLKQKHDHMFAEARRQREYYEKALAEIQAKYDALREEKWIAVSDQWPYDDCDVKLRDGSILRNVIPQSDRDFCWQSPFGEVFICEFSVTHWTGHRMVLL